MNTKDKRTLRIERGRVKKKHTNSEKGTQRGKIYILRKDTQRNTKEKQTLGKDHTRTQRKRTDSRKVTQINTKVESME